MISITKKDIVWNYLGTVLNLSMNVLILPFVLRLLTVQELGLWYVFGSVAALVQLMDFGFAPAIMRNISYAWSGVISFIAEGHIIFLLWPGKNQLDFWLFMNFCGAAAGYLSGKLSVYLKIKKGENK